MTKTTFQTIRLRYRKHYLERLAEWNALYGTGEQPTQEALYHFDLHWSQIASILDELKQSQGEAEANEFLVEYLLEGRSLFNLRLHPDERIALIQSAVVHLRVDEQSSKKRYLLFMLGWAYYNKSKYDLAESIYQSIARSPEISTDERLQAEVLGSLARLFRATNRYDEALHYHLNALRLERNVHNRRRQASTLGDIGNIYRHKDDLTTAIDYYEESLALHREVGDRRSEGIRLGNLGLAYSGIGENAKAETYYRQALIIANALGDTVNKVLNQGNLANLLRNRGDYEEAELLYLDTITLAKLTGDTRHEALWLGHLGRLYAFRKQHSEAFLYYEQAISMLASLGDTRYRIIHLKGLVNLYINTRHQVKLAPHLHHLLQVGLESHDISLQLFTLTHLRNLAQEAKDDESQKDYQNQITSLENS